MDWKFPSLIGFIIVLVYWLLVGCAIRESAESLWFDEDQCQVKLFLHPGGGGGGGRGRATGVVSLLEETFMVNEDNFIFFHYNGCR